MQFQRITWSDKKCKEIEENNRMGKTRNLFKKIRDAKGTFHAKMGTIKDRSGMDAVQVQYTSKFGRLSISHRTGKDQFSFQSQRKATSKNAQTTAQLHSSHTLGNQCSKFSKPGSSSM